MQGETLHLDSGGCKICIFSKNNYTYIVYKSFILLQNKKMTKQNPDPKAKDQNLNENQASKKKWLWGLMKWFNKFTSKVQEKAKNIWNPVDKIVWGVKNIWNPVDKIVWGVKNIWNPVDKIVWGVTGFLDKVEKKIEKVSGVDLDSLATMPKKEEEKADEKTDVDVEVKEKK